MKLLTTSWHSRLYTLTYGEGFNLPTNLCPYFWKIVIGIITFIPFTVYYLPLLITTKGINLVRKDLCEDVFVDGYFSVLFFASLFCYGGLTILFSMIYMWFQSFGGGGTPFQLLGTTGWLALFVTGIIYLITYIKTKIKTKKPIQIKQIKEPLLNIFVEFIKAKYNRYCPTIEWTSKPIKSKKP